ncbi:MAG TPA: molybdopterin-dependent oxidoreductase [Dissulfurispiraceae bacterium]|nr:molybdopterin-dependent oxidoreductase [Dissulfurispiraceae bacterium]
MPSEIKRSVCPYDCPDTCSLLVYVNNGVVDKVAGDPDHPFTRGMLCPKMTHYERTVCSPLRIKTPLVRTGPKGKGEFRKASWDEVVGLISDRWKTIISAFGPEAILPCSYAGTMGLVQRNCGHAFFYRMGASQLERTICSPAKGAGWKAIMGNTQGPHPDEMIQSDLVVLWGINAAATSIHSLRGVHEAKRHGADVWLIDTYETHTARTADRVFLTRPGSDGALALGMMHVLIRDGLADNAFIAKHVKGFAELRDAVLPQYTPKTVSSITGLSATIIEEMARLYGAATAPFIRLGSGLSRYANGAMTVRAITCLPAISGAWSKPGGGMLAGTSTGPAIDTSRITREDFLSAETRKININRLGHALTEPDSPPVKSLYVYHCNPAAVVPDQNKVLQGLARNDLFTVVHERFLTDTAIYADIILPATSSLEHSDIYLAYGHYCVQRAFPAISPIGEAKSNWDTFRILAAAMGFEDPYFRQTADELIDDILSTPSEWLAQTDIEKLKSGRPVELPLAHDYKMTFKTPSGRIEILNPSDPDPLPRYEGPHGDDASYWLMTAPMPLMLNSSFNERDDLLANERMTLKMNPSDAADNRFADGRKVVAFNSRGEVAFHLSVTSRVPKGVVVAEGVWWLSKAPGSRTVNALTSQRLTDRGSGSTFYDTKVNVRAQ